MRRSQAGVQKAAFGEVLDAADAVSLHAPLIKETRGQMDAAAFERMQDTACLINVVRGGLAVEDDFVDTLHADEITSTGLDVFETEPSSQGDAFPQFESPLPNLDSVIRTPHVAWLC